MRDPKTGETTPTELEGLLRDRGHRPAVVVGLATDYCVSATALDAVGSASRPRSSRTRSPPSTSQPGDGERALGAMRAAGCVLGYCFGTLRPSAVAHSRETATVRLHLVDATYELFRAHYAPRPPTLGRDGMNLSGVAGLIDQLLYLLREEGATHVGCATDHVIESFRNDLFPGYKSSAGMPRELLDQFPIAEDAIRALGLVVWPMVEFEADDAIAAACVRFARRPGGRAGRGLHARQGHGPARRDARVVLLDRRRRITYDEPAVMAKWGVPPPAIPDWLALVGDSSDGYPGPARLGREVGRRGPRPLRLARGRSRRRRRRGTSRASAARPCSPRRSASAGTRCCSTARWPGCGRPRTASTSRSARRRAALARRTEGRLGGVLRRMGTAAVRGTAPSLGFHGRRVGPGGLGWPGAGGSQPLTRPSSSAWWAAGRPGRRSSVACGQRRTRARRARSVTVAPARSAIRPAAAMSHDDSPPCWTKASNRPLPT